MRSGIAICILATALTAAAQYRPLNNRQLAPAPPASAQTNNANYTNAIVNAPAGALAQPNAVAPTNTVPGQPPALPSTPAPQVVQPALPETPAVTVFVQGTVPNEEQKQLITRRLQDIPGVLVITNRIHVIGDINEAAGASRTNQPRRRVPLPSKGL
jgi:hypothetical protein